MILIFTNKKREIILFLRGYFLYRSEIFVLKHKKHPLFAFLCKVTISRKSIDFYKKHPLFVFLCKGYGTILREGKER